MAKARRPIAVAAVGRLFDDKCIETLALGLPANADKQRFAEGVREAARIYARDAREPTDNDLHREIKKLHRAAERQQHDQLAALIENLSSKARNLLNTRGARLGVALPSPEALCGAQAAEASAAIAKLTQYGGELRKGRKRPGGKRSRVTLRPYLYAPDRTKNFPKREAERNLIIMLQIAWLDAVGALPSVAVNRERPSAFAKIATQCFKLVGSNADAIGLINDVNRHRKELKEGLSSIKTRTS